MRKLILTTLLAGLIVTNPKEAWGQDITGWLRNNGLSEQDLQKAARGEVVTKVMNSSDANEVAVLGVVVVKTPRAEAAARLGNTRWWLANMPGRTALGIFGAVPSASDALGLNIDAEEINSFKKCRVGSCDIKLPSSSMKAFQESIDFDATTGPRSANQIVRTRLAQYALEYMKSGDDAMVEYADDRTPLRAAEVAARLRKESNSLLVFAPEIKAYMERYPTDKTGFKEDIYWSVDKVKGMKPVVGLTQAVAGSGQGQSQWLVEKQLYGSHYFGGALTITALWEMPQVPGSWLLTVRRMRFDKLPSGGLLNIKGRVINKVQESLGQEIAKRKTGLEKP